MSGPVPSACNEEVNTGFLFRKAGMFHKEKGYVI